MISMCFVAVTLLLQGPLFLEERSLKLKISTKYQSFSCKTGLIPAKVTIKIRQTVATQVGTTEVPMELEAVKSDSSQPANNASGSKQKRTKERKIGQVIDKVLTWRKLYTGYNDPATGQLVKMSLEEAANKVGISKKSLDDYLLQIR